MKTLAERMQQLWDSNGPSKRKRLLQQAGRYLRSRLYIAYQYLPRDVKEDLEYQLYISEQTNPEQARKAHSTKGMML